MTTAFTALSGSCFWSRHVLLSGPKLQNTNCTNMFPTAVTRHKQQTSGRLQMANNTIVKCFFQIYAAGKYFISSIMSKFWWYTFHRQHKLPIKILLLSKEYYFPLIFIAMIWQIFCLSPLLLMRIWCQFCPSWMPFEHSNFFLRLQPHDHMTSETWTSIVYSLVV